MIAFVGQVDGPYIKAAVLLNGEIVSIDGPVWFTLDQWHRLRDENAKNEISDDYDTPIWATTPDEYEESVGERIEP